MTNTTQTLTLMEHVLKFWPILASVITVMLILAGHSISLAMDVNSSSDKISELDDDVKQIQNVQVDINKLNISNATLQKDVENVKEKINETNNQIQETNLLLKNLIVEQREAKAQPAPVQQMAPVQQQAPQVIYVVPDQQQYQQRPQYQIPTPFDGGRYAPQLQQQRAYQPNMNRNYQQQW